MSGPNEFLQLLADGDVNKLVNAWRKLFPAMPVPDNYDQAEIVMHHARTQTERLAIRHRAYSHAWLMERALPSGLPDRLKPSAERLYPVKALAVGVSVNYSSPWLQPAARAVRGVMEHAVLEAHEDGKLADSAHVTRRMMDARKREEKALFGSTGAILSGRG